MFYRGVFSAVGVKCQPFMQPDRGGDLAATHPILRSSPWLLSHVERAYAVGDRHLVLNQHTWVQEDDFIMKQLLPSPRIQYIVRTVTTRWDTQSAFRGPDTKLDIIIHKAPQGREGFKRLLECDPAKHALIHYGGPGVFMLPKSIADPIYAFAKERLSACTTNFFQWSQEGGLVAAIKQAAYYGCARAYARIGDVEIRSFVLDSETGPAGAPKCAYLELKSGSSELKFQLDLDDPEPNTNCNRVNLIHATVEGAESLFARLIGTWNPETSKLGPAPVHAEG
jgi:hypothetical protein